MTDKYLHVHYVGSTAEFARLMRAENRTIIAIDNIPGSVNMAETTLTKRAVLVFGQEGPGISEEMAQAADKIVAIEQFGSSVIPTGCTPLLAMSLQEICIESFPTSCTEAVMGSVETTQSYSPKSITAQSSPTSAPVRTSGLLNFIPLKTILSRTSLSSFPTFNFFIHRILTDAEVCFLSYAYCILSYCILVRTRICFAQYCILLRMRVRFAQYRIFVRIRIYLARFRYPYFSAGTPPSSSHLVTVRSSIILIPNSIAFLFLPEADFTSLFIK